jgi:hypothetical protein
VRLDKTSRGYQFLAERLSFSSEVSRVEIAMRTRKEKAAFNDAAIAAERAVTEEKAMTEALCVSIKHIIVIISRLRLAFSVDTKKLNLCVLIKLLVDIIFRLRGSRLVTKRRP